MTAGVRAGPAPAAGVRLTSLSTGGVNATAGGSPGSMLPSVQVEAGHNYLFTAWIQTNGIGLVAMTPVFARFDGSVCAEGYAPAVMDLPAHLIGFHSGKPHWEPMMLPVTPPSDAFKVMFTFHAEGGAVLDLYALSFR